MLSPTRLINSYRLFAALLALPWALLAAGYWLERLFYGEVVHESGEWAIRLTMAALLVTPLRRLFPRHAWTAWLVERRRYLGVAAFVYALLHAGVYVHRAGLATTLGEAVELGLLTGWLALLIFLPLAATSNDASVRRMGLAWKRLHRFVYLAAVLSFAHWVLVAFDPLPGYVHLAILAAFELARVIVERRRKQQRPPVSRRAAR
jgi:methionine sulfoxide reductase heme-binding subunit